MASDDSGAHTTAGGTDDEETAPSLLVSDPQSLRLLASSLTTADGSVTDCYGQLTAENCRQS